MKASYAQLKANKKWDAKHTTKMTFKFNLTNDADVLQALDESGNKQGYVKRLIREDIERSKNNEVEN